jgi:uroporphyrinogen-III synthase
VTQPYVVVTRPSQQAGKLARMVAGLGRECVVLPLLEITPLPDQRELKAVLADLSGYAMVAFVSPNAIDAAFAHIAAWPPGVAAAVLGEGSRAALAVHGLTDANTTIFTPHDKTRSDSRELMADGLRAAGAVVTTVAAYRRITPALSGAFAQQLSRLLEGENDWIITSSEALRGLLTLVAQLDDDDAVAKMQRQRLIVPHARIAETAQDLGLTRLTLSGSGDERLLAALQSRP